MRAVLRVVDVRPWVGVDEPVFQRPIDEDGELAGGGRDRLGLADAKRQAAIEGAEGGLRAAEVHRREPQDGGGAIGGRLGAAAEESPAGDLVLGGERQPGRKVLFAGPAQHVGADFREEAERIVGTEAVDLREIDAGQMMQRRPQVTPRFIAPRFLAASRGRQRRRGGGDRGGEALQVGLDGGIARGQVPLILVEAGEVLLEYEDVLRTVIAGERGDDLRFGGVTPIIPMLRQVLRIANIRMQPTRRVSLGGARLIRRRWADNGLNRRTLRKASG